MTLLLGLGLAAFLASALGACCVLYCYRLTERNNRTVPGTTAHEALTLLDSPAFQEECRRYPDTCRAVQAQALRGLRHDLAKLAAPAFIRFGIVLAFYLILLPTLLKIFVRPGVNDARPAIGVHLLGLRLLTPTDRISQK